MLQIDFDDLSITDLAVIFVVSDIPVSKSRLQKTILLFDEIFGMRGVRSDRNPYFFEGYSDYVEESAVSLTSAGILDEFDDGYLLTSYGRDLRSFAAEHILKNGDRDERRIVEGMPKIVESISEIPDRNVVGLAHHYYGKIAIKPSIRESVERFNRTARYDGRRLDEIPKEEFESTLRDGIRLGLDARWVNRRLSGPPHTSPPCKPSQSCGRSSR